MVCLFLEERYGQLLRAKPSPYAAAIHEALRSGNEMLRLMYGHGLFLRRDTAVRVVELGYQFLSAYLSAAGEALSNRSTRFKITPKFHAVIHIIDIVRAALQHEHAQWLPNPCMYSCQQDEDFVGKVSLLSLGVASRSVHKQVLARSAINLWQHWGDFAM